MALLLRCALLSVLLCAFDRVSSTDLADMDYGGVPLWINVLLDEPTVLSLQGRMMDGAWFRANNPLPCPLQCDCPIHWPTALYCDHRGLAEVPDSLPDRTQYLFLQHNNISSMSSSSLANVSGLHWLIVDHNRLRSDTLDGAFLGNQTGLRYLFANHNRLTSVPSGLPAGLEQLRLAYNRISSVGPGALQGLHNLTLLLLQGNRLQTIAQGDLKGLLSLNLLDLSGNLLSSVPRLLPPTVQQLYLSNNTLSGLDADSFQGLPRLKFLRLSRCRLGGNSSVHQGAFNLSSLVELDLSYNKLTGIPTVPTTLQYLYLEANQIQVFNTSSFCREVGPLSFSRMKILRLEGNKLSYQQLPPDLAFCLQELQSVYI